MNESSFDSRYGTLDAQRERLERGTRLRRSHWLVLASSLVLTLFAWESSTRAMERRERVEFGHHVREMTDRLVARVRDYADLLRTGSSMLTVSDLDRERWSRHATRLDLSGQYPAVHGFGFLYRVPRERLGALAGTPSGTGLATHPTHDAPTMMPVVAIHPRRLEGAVLGLDLAYEPRRRRALEDAFRSGETRITAPVHLRAYDAPGFLMFAPFRRDATAGAHSVARAAPATGAVVASIRIEDIVAATRGRERDLVRLRISDAGETVYDGIGAHADAHDGHPPPSLSTTLSIHGRTWRIDALATDEFHDSMHSALPVVILVGGLLVDGLLLAALVLLSRANRRALDFAGRVGERLRAESDSLRRANVELGEANRSLEAFASVVSHDLRTPLNGIGHLAGFLEEDLEAYLAGPHADPAVARHLERLRANVRRSHALIDGVLDYSAVGERIERPAEVDVGALVEDIGDALDVAPGALRVQGELPVLETFEIPLRQVLSNLIGNAFKYHGDPERARVAVRAREAGSSWRFEVEDDGPGIDPADHERIFEPFRRLSADADVEGTGVGLAIVKRTIERLGGSVRVVSARGEGTTFAFDWPARVAGGSDAPRDAHPDGADGIRLEKAA